MPGLDPFTLGIGVVSAIPQLLAARSQKRKANRLRLQDTTPDAFKEQLAGLRLDAGTKRLPGVGAAENKLAQNFAAGAGAATRAGGSAADVMAGINALSVNRQAGQNALTTQGVQYQDASKQRLNGGLSQLAAYQAKDQADFSRNKAALMQASNQNLQNAIGGLTGFGALARQQSLPTAEAQAPVAGVDPMEAATMPALQGLGFPQLPGQLPYYNPTAASGVGLSGYGRVRRKQQGVGV